MSTVARDVADQEILLAGGEPHELEFLLQLGVVQHLLVLLFPGGTGGRAGAPPRPPPAIPNTPELNTPK